MCSSDDWRKDRGTEAEASPFLAAKGRCAAQPVNGQSHDPTWKLGVNHSPMADQAGVEPAITAIAVASHATDPYAAPLHGVMQRALMSTSPATALPGRS